MSNVNDTKTAFEVLVKAPGIIKNTAISDEDRLRVVVSGATGSNIILVKARIVGQDDYDTIGTITGDIKVTYNINVYDIIQLECIAYQTSGSGVKVVASSFNQAGSATSIGAPSGDLIVNPDQVNFISSDSSVEIITNNADQTIDIRAIGGGGGGAAKYTGTIALINWIGPSAGEYTLTIPFATHAISNPMIMCFEKNGLTYDQIMVPTNIDASFNIVLTVNETPDTRFIGKFVIE